MLKVFFDHSIFLHQQNGGISKYICRLYEGLIKSKYKIKAEIFSRATVLGLNPTVLVFRSEIDLADNKILQLLTDPC